MEPDQIDFRDVADNATRSVLVRLYAYIGKLLRAVNAIVITPPVPGPWTDIALGAFQNGWTNWGSPPYTSAGYRLEADGNTVRLKGLIAGGTLGLVAFVLPAGFRPNGVSRLHAANSGNVGVGAVQVDATGVVTPSGPSNVYITLDGITFTKT